MAQVVWRGGLALAIAVGLCLGLSLRASAKDEPRIHAVLVDEAPVLDANLDDPVWQQAEGPTVLAPFPVDTEYFDRPEQQFMLNFRVGDLEQMITELEAKGITVITKDEWNSEIGSFARIHDPEGNPIELWEPQHNPQ